MFSGVCRTRTKPASGAEVFREFPGKPLASGILIPPGSVCGNVSLSQAAYSVRIDQEDTGPDADPWGAYGLFEDDEFADCFRGD